MTAATDTEWELDVRARKMTRAAQIIAGFLVVAHIGAAVVLRSGGDTGVHLRVADQIAMVLIGLVVAAGVLLFTRPRLRVGASGISIRNMFQEKHFGWSHVRGISFPHDAPWAHLELPDDEYLAVVAVQARDGAHAVDALERFRAIEARYGRGVGADG
ncbi:PH domain-containing protein [Rhodococcus sp. HNM0563]|uniref:PH domain-containing protein n=1 Tax=Rhodococcus sp. HNM0563 TaxID=2716339 RepID=UPI00146DDF17|nr:PH domain-containing protein [Rhodococcus sp. HNM0563]